MFSCTAVEMALINIALISLAFMDEMWTVSQDWAEARELLQQATRTQQNKLKTATS